MLLTSRALAFVQEVENYKKKREIAGEADKFASRAKQLKSPSERLAMLQTLAHELVDQGIAPVLPAVLIDAIAERANTHLSEFENDSKSFVEPSASLAHEFIPMLGKLETDYKHSILKAWSQHVEVLVKPLPDAVLRAIETLPAYRAQVVSLRAKHVEAEKLTKKPPELGDVESALKRINQLIDENAATWKELSGSGIPDDVLDFLRKSGAMGGVSLSEVTPSIIDWLNGRNLLTSFTVRVR